MPRKITSPVVTSETQPFWQAAREGRFLVPFCAACGKAHWYPRTYCPFCSSGETKWEESPGEGVIYTYSVMHRNTPVPYAIGYVTLDEGVSLLTNFVECDFDSLSIGQRVKLKWSPTGEGNPPVFTFTPA